MSILKTVKSADIELLRWIRTTGHSDQLEAKVRKFSKLGEHAAVWLVIGFAGMVCEPKRRSRWQRAVGAVIAGYLLNIALKFIVRRKRPQLEDLPQLATTPTQLSFPSAHSTSSFVAAAVYGPLLRKDLLYVAATSMALSRLYLGVHYPTDVLAGAALGTAVGRFSNSQMESL